MRLIFFKDAWEDYLHWQGTVKLGADASRASDYWFV